MQFEKLTGNKSINVREIWRSYSLHAKWSSCYNAELENIYVIGKNLPTVNHRFQLFAQTIKHICISKQNLFIYVHFLRCFSVKFPYFDYVAFRWSPSQFNCKKDLSLLHCKYLKMSIPDQTFSIGCIIQGLLILSQFELKFIYWIEPIKPIYLVIGFSRLVIFTKYFHLL